MAMTPTSRTLKRLRDEGWECQVVEQWIAQARRRRDLFGIIDIVAIRSGRTLGVQATSLSNVSSRVKKVAESGSAGLWIDAGNDLEVWGWGKGKSGYRVRRVRFTMDASRQLALEEITPD